MDCRVLAILAVSPLLLACPANSATEDGVGETGEDVGIPIALDPFDGEGSNPPGNPDPYRSWPQPMTLGNGLVHDSRYDLEAGEYSATFSAAELVSGVDWAEGFVSSHALKQSRGFRSTQVAAEVGITTNPNGTIVLSVTDRSVYVSDDDANYKTQIKTYLFDDTNQEQALAGAGVADKGEPRPTSIDTFALPDGHVGANVALVWDNNPVPWEMVVGQSLQTFDATLTGLQGEGYRPISISSRRRNGVSEYAGIFVNDGVAPSEWKVMLGHDAIALALGAQAEWDAGYYPFAGTYEQGSQNLPRFNAIWVKRSPDLKLELRYNMNDVLFEAEDIEWRRRGYHLEGACAYKDAGFTRYAGLWMRHEPYLRWREGVPIDMTTQDYIERYKPFHEKAIVGLTIEGIPGEGEFFRPSATLHIFEGDELVLNRAYTYAGAIYPDTRLNATMGTASASKSITAAAVVRELNERGISLNAPFAGAAGIDTSNVSAMEKVPTIADVLRNVGGFNEGTSSYNDHSLIDASPHGQYPITGKMMYDYALDQHLDKYKKNNPNERHADSYWNESTYKESHEDPNELAFVYSNPGFSMLGELVRVQSGLTYEDYVHKYFLEKLQIDNAIYPDRGHRNAANEPTRAGLRSYLINGGHPYNPVGCATDTDCAYLTCSADDPNIQGCITPFCGPQNTCVGCTTNKNWWKCKPNWACEADACVNTITPLSRSERTPGDNSSRWSNNTGPVDPSAPASAAILRYAGRSYAGGAPLAAGGWHADGESLGILTRSLAQSSYLMPQSVAAQIWSPVWWNWNQDRADNWAYGLGWYVRGNWVAMIGGSYGEMSLVLHNRAYDFTVVYLTNVLGNPFDQLFNPLFDSKLDIWSSPGAPQSIVGEQFPCIDDLSTLQNECKGFYGAY